MSARFYPELIGLNKEEITVVAAMGRVMIPDGVVTEMDEMDDRELAASLLGLQEKGFITLTIDPEDNPQIILNTDPEKARIEYAARRANRGPSRRERRASRRRS